MKVKLSQINAGSDALAIEVNSTKKLPKVTNPRSILYADEDGALHKNDPAQEEFRFTEVEGGAAEEVAVEETEEIAAAVE